VNKRFEQGIDDQLPVCRRQNLLAFLDFEKAVSPAALRARVTSGVFALSRRSRPLSE
jgi:hypothetical protein